MTEFNDQSGEMQSEVAISESTERGLEMSLVTAIVAHAVHTLPDAELQKAITEGLHDSGLEVVSDHGAASKEKENPKVGRNGLTRDQFLFARAHPIFGTALETAIRTKSRIRRQDTL